MNIIDPLLARRVVQFLAEGSLISFPYSFYTEIAGWVSEQMGPSEAVKLHNAKDVFEHFVDGLNNLQFEARRPRIRKDWDDDTRKLWEKVKNMIRRSRSKNFLFESIKVRLEETERNFFSRDIVT